MTLFTNRKAKKEDVANAGSLFANNNLQTSPYSSQQKTAASSAQLSKQPVQGSGYTSNYVNNPTTQPQQPATTTQPTQQPRQTYSSLTNQYLNRATGNADYRIGTAQQQAQDQIDLQKQLSESRGKTLSNLGNLAGESLGRYSDQLRSGLDIQRGTAERQQKEAQTGYDEQRYYNEKSRQSRMKGLENTLAGLGTLQSSALGNIGATINIGAERQDRSAQRDLNTRVADIQDEYRMIENQAESLIQQEADRYQQYVESLRGQMDENSIQFKQAVSQIAQQADDRINNILDGLDQFTYQTQAKLLEAEQGSSNPLGASQLTELADIDNSAAQLDSLYGTIDSYANLMGPVQGRINSMNPYNTDAQAFQSSMKGIAQQVGKAMEGGVLRAEDVPKYEAILPKITDTPDAAKAKIDNVIGMLQQQRQIRESTYSSAGYDPVQSQYQPGINQNDISNLLAQF